MIPRTLEIALNALTFGAALGALGWSWIQSRKSIDLEQRLNTLRTSHFRLVEENRREVETLRKQVHELKLEVRRQQGRSAFEGEMTIAQAYETHPQAEAILASFHLGGCASCAVSPDETIAHAATSHNIELNVLLRSLNSLFNQDASQVVQQLTRTPNVKLEL